MLENAMVVDWYWGEQEYGVPLRQRSFDSAEEYEQRWPVGAYPKTEGEKCARKTGQAEEMCVRDAGPAEEKCARAAGPAEEESDIAQNGRSEEESGSFLR